MQVTIAQATLIALTILVSPGFSLGCSDPAVHPEMAEFNAVLQALPPQPPSPVQLKFRIDGDRQIGNLLTIRIAFWQNGQAKGKFLITPSHGVVLDGSPNAGEIPYRSFVDVTVRPIKKGYHHLKVETTIDLDGVELRRTELVGIAIALDDVPVAGKAAAGRFDFVGSKLRQVLTETPGQGVTQPMAGE
jgi:hypothetical protein